MNNLEIFPSTKKNNLVKTTCLFRKQNDLSGVSAARMLPSRHDDLGKNRGLLGKWKEMAVSLEP